MIISLLVSLSVFNTNKQAKLNFIVIYSTDQYRVFIQSYGTQPVTRDGHHTNYNWTGLFAGKALIDPVVGEDCQRRASVDHLLPYHLKQILSWLNASQNSQNVKFTIHLFFSLKP